MIENLYKVLPTILYFLGFCGILVFLFCKHKDVTIKYIVGIWCVSSFFAIIYQWADSFHYNELSIIPYLFLIVCFLLTLFPLFNRSDLALTSLPDVNFKLLKVIIYLFVVFSIVPFFENLVHFVSTYSVSDTSGLADTYEEKMNGSGLKVYWLSSIGKIGNSLDGLFKDFLIFIPFYILAHKKSSKRLLVASFIPIGNHILFQLNASGRTLITIFLLVGVFYVLLYRKLIDGSRIKMIKKIGVIVISLALISMSVLTLSRHEATNRNVPVPVVVGYYVAKSHVDFNEKVWYMRKHMEGDNSFGLLKSIVGLPTPKNKNNYWTEAKTGIKPNLFYTYIGDWVMDFGAGVAFVLFALVSCFANKYFQGISRTKSIVKLFLFSSYCQVIVNGWTYNCYKTPNALINFFISFILVLLIQILTHIKKERSFS